MTSCFASRWASSSLANRASQASRIWARKSAEASTGETLRAPLGRAPGEDGRLAVDPGVAEPALGAGDEVPGDACPLNPGELADDPVRILAPGEPRRAGRQLVGTGEVEERGEHCPGRGLAGGDELRDLERPDVGGRPLAALRVHVGHGAVGRPEVDPDDVSRACHEVPDSGTWFEARPIIDDDARPPRPESRGRPRTSPT